MSLSASLRLGLGVLAPACLLLAQDPAPDANSDQPVFSTGIKLVSVIATVRNKRGEIVRNLTKDDFSILENGRPQNIRYFSQDTDLPLTIGLMIDTSMSQQRVLNAERGASFRFLDEVLREDKDHVFIMQYDMVIQMRQGLTSSRRELDDALSYVDTPDRQELRSQWGGGTLLFDAIVKASKETMSKQAGRKALIVLSDGGDNGSDSSVLQAIEAAQRADTLIYAILFADSGFGDGEGRKWMMRLARETGGGYFEVSKKQGIDRIFSLIEEEIRSEYSIGYVSDAPVRISEFRKLQLLTGSKDLIVQARDRYWAKR